MCVCLRVRRCVNSSVTAALLDDELLTLFGVSVYVSVCVGAYVQVILLNTHGVTVQLQ